MQVIVVGSAKGGVGKTTITANLAVEAERQGTSVAIADLDPIRSLSNWHRLRRSQNHDASPCLIEDVETPHEAIEKAAEQGVDWLLIDTSPGLLTFLELALSVADLFVLPLRPSPIDVQTVDRAIEVADKFQVPRLVVLNCAEPNSDLSEGTRLILKELKVPVWEEEIAYRDIHMRSMLTGHTAIEDAPNSIAGREIHSLWARVHQLTLDSSKQKRSGISKTRRRRARK